MHFAVEVRHLWRVISFTGNPVRSHRRIDARDVCGSELQIECAERLLELVAAARPKHRHDVVAP